jgi:rfaE bifunctional protein nucleotidyltransferase chain/domain
MKSFNLEKLKSKHKIIFASGVFDLLHSEHIKFLKKAKQLGGILIVGVESNARVKKLKGQTRPIETVQERVAKVENLNVVDYAFELPQSFGEKQVREKLIKKLKPDYLAVSSNSPHLDSKREMVEKYNGQLVIVHEHNPKVSTSILIDSMNKGEDE